MAVGPERGAFPIKALPLPPRSPPSEEEREKRQCVETMKRN